MAGKSILVIDTPKDCGGCPLCSKDENYWGDIISAECQMQYKGYLTLNEMEKPNWCPLRPLPEKKPVSYHDDLYGDVEKNYTNIGWNSCLEELEK